MKTLQLNLEDSVTILQGVSKLHSDGLQDTSLLFHRLRRFLEGGGDTEFILVTKKDFVNMLTAESENEIDNARTRSQSIALG